MLTDNLVSKSEFARLRKVSPAMVTKWLNAGRLVMDGKRVMAAESMALLGAVQDPARGGKDGKSRARPTVYSPNNVQPSFDQHRTTREGFTAKQAELDYLERVGKLVERSRYDKALEDGLRVIMSALDSLAPRLGPRLVGLDDLRQIQNVIDDEVEKIRADAAATVRALTNGQSPTRQ